MRDARTWIARLATVGLCLMGVGCGSSGVPDPSSDPSVANEAPPPPVSGVAPSTVAAPEAAPAAPAKAAGPQLAQNDPAPAPAPAAVEAVATPAPAAAPAPAGNDQPTVVATADAPGDAAAAPGEEKPAQAAKGDSSGTTELLNLSNNASNAAPPAEVAKEEVPAATPGAMPMPGAAMPPPGANPNAIGQPGFPGRAMGPAAEDARAGGGMFGGGNNQGVNAPANYTYPMTGATTFLNAVKSKNKDRIAEATALHAPTEAHSVAMQKLFAQVVDLSISDAQVDELAKSLQGYTIMGMNPAVSSGRQKVVLGKSNGSNGRFQRTLTMRKEAKGWKVCDISGQSEQQGYGGMPMFRGGRRR